MTMDPVDPTSQDTPREIEERLLSWLHDTLTGEQPPQGVAAEFLQSLESSATEDDPASLDALWSSMTALAQEVRLQGREFHDLKEQLDLLNERSGLALDAHEEAIGTARALAADVEGHRDAAARAGAEEVRREVAELLIDLRDRLTLGLRTVGQVGGEIEATHNPPLPPSSLFGRLFGRAPHSPPLPSLEPLAKGYQLGLDRLDDVLYQWDISPIDAEGEPFDPRMMNAVDAIDAPGVEEGTVVDVIREGYLREGDLLRAAQVRICRRQGS